MEESRSCDSPQITVDSYLSRRRKKQKDWVSLSAAHLMLSKMPSTEMSGPIHRFMTKSEPQTRILLSRDWSDWGRCHRLTVKATKTGNSRAWKWPLIART